MPRTYENQSPTAFQRRPRISPITDNELKHTTVYAIQIESWSGKENWQDKADQSEEWPALEERWFE